MFTAKDTKIAKVMHGKVLRLARYLAAAGVASRRACETLIREGKVTVNGECVTTPAVNVTPDQDEVQYAGRPVRLVAHRYVMLYKPAGVTCSAQDRHASRLVGDLIPDSLGRLFTIGRLDRDSEGLLLLTNDGEFAERLAHPRYQVPRRYRVWVRGDVTPACLEAWRRGVQDAGEFLRPQSVQVLSRDRNQGVLEFVLTEGKKREVRRLCASVGLGVHRLVRVALGGLALDGLNPGEWRDLTQHEVQGLLAVGSEACPHPPMRRFTSV